MTLYAAEPAYWSGSASQLGSFGVDIFFALSGLLITLLLLRDLESGQLSLRSFYIRRAFRILPPLLVFLAICVALGRIRPGWELLSSVLLFRNYLPSSLGGHTSGHLWSLRSRSTSTSCGPPCSPFGLFGKGPRSVAYLAIGAGFWRLADIENGFTASLFRDLPAHFRTDQRLDALLWGCFAAFLVHRLRHQSVDSESLWKRVVRGAARHNAAGNRDLFVLGGTVPAHALCGAIGPHNAASGVGREQMPGIAGSFLRWAHLLQPVLVAAGLSGPGLAPEGTAPNQLVLKPSGAFVAAMLSYQFVENPASPGAGLWRNDPCRDRVVFARMLTHGGSVYAG